MTSQDECAIVRQDAIHTSLAYMVKYIIIEGTYAEQLQAQAVLSAQAAAVAQRVAEMNKKGCTGPFPLPPSSPDFLSQQMQARQAGNLAPVLWPETRRES